VPNTEAFNRKFVWTGAPGIASRRFLDQSHQIDYEDKSDGRNPRGAETRKSTITTQAASNYASESSLRTWHANPGQRETD
jgi:hypothetical protein